LLDNGADATKISKVVLFYDLSQSRHRLNVCIGFEEEKQIFVIVVF
jgi:hypothetical protein